jgi:hypothetical protein
MLSSEDKFVLSLVSQILITEGEIFLEFAIN